METSKRETFEGWAILELMGHRRLAGRLSEATIAGGAFVRLDMPKQDGTEVTQFYSPSAVYCITPTSEELARRIAAGVSFTGPVSEYELPRLTAGASSADDQDDEGEPAVDAFDEYSRSGDQNDDRW